jgi:hypothetical protein
MLSQIRDTLRRLEDVASNLREIAEDLNDDAVLLAAAERVERCRAKLLRHLSKEERRSVEAWT